MEGNGNVITMYNNGGAVCVSGVTRGYDLSDIVTVMGF
jgi:hypothetical protein